MESEDQIFRKIIDQRDRYYRIAYSYVGNEQDAMDIVQEVACKALKHLKKLKEPEYAETWLFRVTVNASLDFLRKRKREQVGLPAKEEGRADDHGSLLVFDLLRRVDPESRAVILLHCMEGKTFQQISRILGKNVSTVKSLYYRATKALKTQLTEEAVHHVREPNGLDGIKSSV